MGSTGMPLMSSSAMPMGNIGASLMSNGAGIYNAQPYINQGYPQSYINTPAYQQLQAQNGLVNLAAGVINKLPNNLISSNPSTADKMIGVAKNQATSAAADAALSSASDAAAQAASDAAAQAAVEQAAAADAQAAQQAAAQAAAEQAAQQAAADAAAQAAAEQAAAEAAAADAAASSVVDVAAADSSGGLFGLPSLSDALGIGDAGVVSDAVDFFGDWGW